MFAISVVVGFQGYKIIIDFLSKLLQTIHHPHRPSGEEVTAEAIKNIIQAVNFVSINKGNFVSINKGRLKIEPTERTELTE